MGINIQSTFLTNFLSAATCFVSTSRSLSLDVLIVVDVEVAGDQCRYVGALGASVSAQHVRPKVSQACIFSPDLGARLGSGALSQISQRGSPSGTIGTSGLRSAPSEQSTGAHSPGDSSMTCTAEWTKT